MKKAKYNNKGVTLIELLIVLAIIGIVLQVLYSIFFIGNKSFNTSKNKGFAQQDSRIAYTYITNELKTAKFISPNQLTGKYYSLRFENGELYKDLYNEDGTKQIILISNNLNKVEFIHLDVTSRGIINVIIVAEEGKEGKDKQDYKLNFNVLLENIPNYEELIDADIIYYSKYE